MLVRLFPKQGICRFSTVVPSSRLSVKANRIYLEHTTRLNQTNHRPANIAFSVPLAVTPSTGILTRFIDYASSARL